MKITRILDEEAAIEELGMYAMNYADQPYNDCLKFIAQRWFKDGRGDRRFGWDYKLACDYTMRHLVNKAAIDYWQEFGDNEGTWTQYWPLGIRQKTADQIMEVWVTDFEEGYLPF